MGFIFLGEYMKIVSISQELLDKYNNDSEMLQKVGRPCVLVIRLKYKGRNQNFAIPLRSNISASTPKNQYFALPPRPSTKPTNRHGLHYIKMFPVKNKYLVRYRVEGNRFSTLIQMIINKNEQRIVAECQEYLVQYEQGNRPAYSTDIDNLLLQLNT